MAPLETSIVNESRNRGTKEHFENYTLKVTPSHPLIPRYYTCEGIDPFNIVEWEKRDATILSERGEVVFEQKEVEVPKFWSQMATNVVASKYLAGDLKSKEREGSVKDLINRVVNMITEWGERGRYFASGNESQIFKAELSYILLNQYASFNSPVWFNVGVRARPQCSACFIVSVDDTIESLLELQTIEARLFKWGSGTGSNLSKIRSSKEKLSGGGRPSGPVSFMRGFDAWAGIIKSGGKTRRAAKMQILNVDHPDIMEFIDCKCQEERKAWALIEQGYSGGFCVPGGAYDSVAFQNANLSVRVSNRFMEAALEGKEFATRGVKNGEICEQLNARVVLEKIAEATYMCGDPGIQFDDSINDWHTCPASGRINSSNPCSEYMHLDDSACNLSSINLLKFLKEDGSFDCDSLSHTVNVMICAQDILIDNSSYPTQKIENNARNFRQLGLGFANLGALLMTLGIPYDSDEGRSLASSITALMTGQAYLSSAKLAQVVGPFKGYKVNSSPMMKVIDKHVAACGGLVRNSRSNLIKSIDQTWKEVGRIGRASGFRNSQTTVIAPTGTISFMMDCATTGLEPDIALVKYKKLAGGGHIKLVNSCVAPALERLGYNNEERANIQSYIDKNDTIEGAPGFKEQHLSVFDCAIRANKGIRFINYYGHIKMMAAIQPFISGAISKTVNLPSDVSKEEIVNIYLEAWKMGLKSVALYRDSSKRTQPLNVTNAIGSKASGRPVRRRLPDERSAITHKFVIAGVEGYLTVGLFDDGMPGEIFLIVAKEGSILSGIMDAFATSISLALQYGVPLADLVKKFTYVRFEPAGFTGNKEIPSAQSIVDYVFRWLALKFLMPSQLESLGIKIIGLSDTAYPREPKANSQAELIANSADAPPCLNCASHLMVRQAGCYVCLNCGSQGGCG